MLLAATWVEFDYHTDEESQKKTHHMISLTCGISNMIQMNLFTKKETRLTDTDINLWLPKERWGG